MGIFYVKNRLGQYGRPIKICKFRSMVPYSDVLYDELRRTHGLDDYGKIKNDFRITRIGKIIRPLCFDELPQMFTNIPRGEMSWVGIRARDETEWSEYPEYHKREALEHKPGLFGVGRLSEGGSSSGVLKIERQYLQEKAERPFLTDLKYFLKLLYTVPIKEVKKIIN